MIYGVQEAEKSRWSSWSWSCAFEGQVPAPAFSLGSPVAADRVPDVICQKPFIGSFGHEFPCGKCITCRVKHQRVWNARLALEAACHECACFVTLTYAVDPGELVPRDLELFFKKLRNAIHPRKLRYYAVGEYGTKEGRPHYHILLFGVHWTEDALIRKVWEEGFVHVGDVSKASIAYVSDYLLTKDTHEGHIREDGRLPEFHRMSRKPGIGVLAVPVLKAGLTTVDGEVLLVEGDVPCVIRKDKKKWPIGSLLQKHLREAMGRDAGVPLETGLLRSLRSSAESAEDREKRRKAEGLRHAARAAISKSKRSI